MNGMKNFKEKWEDKEREGYQYGRDALEGVRFGWDLAIEEMTAFVSANPGLFNVGSQSTVLNVLSGAKARKQP